MRSINDYKEILSIPPLSEREWNYLFLVGERVKIIPKAFDCQYTQLNPQLKGKIGVVKRYWVDICCIHGTSYLCSVEFDLESIDILAMSLYTNKKFYERSIRSKI